MKTRAPVAVGLALIIAASAPLHASNDFQPRGHIQNDRGQNCTYIQTTDHNSRYFHETLTGRVGTITFDHPRCMSEQDVGMVVNKMMINNILSLWYSHRDADFKTRAHDLYPGSMMQKRGYCIQSSKYPAIGIAVDYEIRDASIVRVRHGRSVQGCTS